MTSALLGQEQHIVWPEVKLGDVADIRSGVTLGRKLRVPTIRLPYLRVANVQDGHLDLREVKEVDVLADELEKWRLQPGDILLTEGGDWDKLGRGTVWRGEIPNCIHQNHIFRVRVKPSEFDPRFLAAFIASPYGKRYFQAASKQTTNLASINRSQLRELVVFRPPLSEQRRIVARIEELAARIERARGLRREAVQEVEAAKMSTGDVIFDESRLSNWCTVELDDVADIRSGVTLGRKLTGPTIRLPYLRVANVQDGHLDLSMMKEVEILASEVDKWQLQPGDILLTEGGDWDKLGRGAVWNSEIPHCIHQNHIFRVRTKPSDFYPRFLAALISSSYGKRYFQASAKQTTNLASINKTQLRTFKVFKPSLAEQQRIMVYLDSVQAKVDTLRRLQTESAAEFDALLPAVLNKAFEGEL